MKTYDLKNLPAEFFQKIEFSNIDSVANILDDVKKNGDVAVKKHAKKFDDCIRDSFIISKEEIEKAYSLVEEEAIAAINFSIQNIKEFAQEQLSSISDLEVTIGGHRLGHKVLPLDSVGCYIPGGNYPLPSTALMTIVPAKVAGVKEIVACSPKIQPVTIVAADLAGADKIFSLGGVQAVGAMAYGTESVPKVCKIVGPGNKFVTAAKKFVYGECGIDFLAGPSEVLIVADNSANPKFIAADMLAQCEHDKDARAYLIALDKKIITEVEKYAQEFLQELSTSEIAKISWEKSIAVLANNLDEVISLSDKRAPEHLEICTQNAVEDSVHFSNYGSLFIGNFSAEVFGDYASGTNHTLPTNQVAKYSGGLSVFDFVKIQTYQIINKNCSSDLIRHSYKLAKAEGLEAHALAAKIRFQNGER